MNLRSPTTAVAWQIWTRNRIVIGLVGIVLATGFVLLAVLHSSANWAGFANSVAYSLTAVVLLLTLTCFHFTEGSKKGGFGSFPMRMFNLPVNTYSLVALPMICGVAAITMAYHLCALLLLPFADTRPPLLWPCLYLIFAVTQFQMIVWSLPESRVAKLLCLSTAASIITFGWMFFVPTIVEGALSEWGFGIDPAVFMRRLLVVLALTGPAAYGVSLYRIHQQRHGSSIRLGSLTTIWERTIGRLLLRHAPFQSIDHALYWQEWRRTGFILPVVVMVVMALTCVPAWLSDGMTGGATNGVLIWLFVAPCLFALIIGRGFGKPDFWSTSLKIAPFHAVRPLAAGQWVSARLKVALISAALTWAMVLYFSFVWTAFAGDLRGPQSWFEWIRFFYTPGERYLLLLLAPPSLLILTWRLLTVSLAAGLSGSKIRYHANNLLIAVGLLGLLVYLIWHDNDRRAVHLYNFWPTAEWLPFVFTIAVIAKMTVAARAWNEVLRRRMATSKFVVVCFAGWLFAVGVLATFFFVACRNTLWLRALLMLAAALIVPLAGPALAMRAFARNRATP